MLNEGIERNEAGEARRNEILRKQILSHAKELGLHLDNYGSPLKRMVGWVELRQERGVIKFLF